MPHATRPNKSLLDCIYDVLAGASPEPMTVRQVVVAVRREYEYWRTCSGTTVAVILEYLRARGHITQTHTEGGLPLFSVPKD